MLVIISVFTGLSEAVTVAIVAEAASALVGGMHIVHLAVGPLHFTVAVGTLLEIALVAALARLVLQAPIVALPARIAVDAQARMRRELFIAFTSASWAEQSRDHEGHLQELMSSQVPQASAAVTVAASLLTTRSHLSDSHGVGIRPRCSRCVAVLGATILIFGLMRPLNNLVIQRSRALSQAQMDFASGVGQAARLAEEIHVFGAAAAEGRRLDEFIRVARDLTYRIGVLARLVPSLYQSCIYVLVVVRSRS